MITTASELYKKFKDEGLEFRKNSGNGRDDVLWRTLVTNLGFSVSITNLTKALEDHNISIERFLGALFKCLEPFTKMIADTCLFLEESNAKQSWHSLAIQYDFKNNEIQEFDVNHFKAFFINLKELMIRGIYRVWDTPEIERFLDKILEHWQQNQFTAIEANHFCWDIETQVPVEFEQDQSLGELCHTVQDLYQSIQKQINGYDTKEENDFDSLFDNPFYNDISRDNVSDFMSRNGLFNSKPSLNNLLSLQGKMQEAALQLSALFYFRSRQKTIERINVLNQFKNLPTTQNYHRQIQQYLEEILNLPVWKHRWLLYQTWAGFQFINTFKAANIPVKIFVKENKIVLHEARPAHIGQIEIDGEPLAFFSELKTKMPAKSTAARQHIQPDFRLTEFPVTEGYAVKVVFECKQYKNMNRKKLTELISDYRCGAENAIVILVNYDQFPDVSLPDENIFLISNFRHSSDQSEFKHSKPMQELSEALKTETRRLSAAVEKQKQAKIEHDEAIEQIQRKCDAKLDALHDSLERRLIVETEKAAKQRFITALTNYTANTDRVDTLILDLRQTDHLFKGIQTNNTLQLLLNSFITANPNAIVYLANSAYRLNSKPILDLNITSDLNRPFRFEPEPVADINDIIKKSVTYGRSNICVIGYACELENIDHCLANIIIHGYTKS